MNYPLAHFPVVFTEALEEWQTALAELCQNSAVANEHLINDFLRAQLLRDLAKNVAFNFNNWPPYQVAIFCCLAIPWQQLQQLTISGKSSDLLTAVFELWSPHTFDQWAMVLWILSRRAFEFFGDLLYLLPDPQKPPLHIIGETIFHRMQFEKDDAASVVGAMVRQPMQDTLVTVHAKQLYELTKCLNETQTAIVCRALIRYRIHHRSQCECGYVPGKTQSCCDRINYNLLLDRKYARHLFRLVMADHSNIELREDKVWNHLQCQLFLRMACDYVFPREIYIEIYQLCMDGNKPSQPLEHPRELTASEKSNCKFKTPDGDYEPHMAQHMVCIMPTCPQMIKKDCSNNTCKTHCTSNGVQDCRVHRVYKKASNHFYLWRKSMLSDNDVLQPNEEEEEGEEDEYYTPWLLPSHEDCTSEFERLHKRFYDDNTDGSESVTNADRANVNNALRKTSVVNVTNDSSMERDSGTSRSVEASPTRPPSPDSPLPDWYGKDPPSKNFLNRSQVMRDARNGMSDVIVIDDDAAERRRYPTHQIADVPVYLIEDDEFLPYEDEEEAILYENTTVHEPVSKERAAHIPWWELGPKPPRVY